MNPIRRLTLAELLAALDAWTPVRKITEVHIHCTDQPRHENFRGLASVEAMRRFHQSIGMSDIAQHLTADPHGFLWTGRPFDAMPASARGHNGTPQSGPFMIEMVGLFQDGVDELAGAQKAAVQAVVCAVLRKCKLDEKAVKFHREFPNVAKTCPGAALDPGTFREEIAEALLAGGGFRELGVSRKTARVLDRDAFFGRGAEEDTTWAEVPEDEGSLEELRELAKWIDRGMLEPEGAAGRDVRLRYRELLPYVVNTSQGRLSREGKMETSEATLDALITHHLTPAFDAPGSLPRCEHLLFYAHGGLNSEEGALDNAKAMVPWWRARGVYPIYFIWESSLLQAIFQRPRELPRAAVPRGELGDKVIEATTQLLARRIWRRMKANARRCSAPLIEDGVRGGLLIFWEKLEVWLQSHPGVKLHAIGHSTGPILLSRFMPLAIAAGHRFETLTYLAPAIRIDDFLADVSGTLGPGKGVDRLRQFTMNDEAERDDDVAKVYRKSLLYYVREACEDDTRGRILGLEKDLYGDPRTRALFGLPASPGVRSASSGGADPVARIEFAQARDAFPQNPFTRATAHGCFDNEQSTMTAVLRGILGEDLAEATFVPDPLFPWEGDSQCGGDASRGEEEDEDWMGGLGACCCPCHGTAGGTGGSPPGVDPDFDPSSGGDGSPSEPPEPHEPSEPPDRKPSGRTGRRLALCVGINDYPRQPLSGCVRDSDDWAAALRSHGFEIERLRNGEATREALASGLRSLIREGREGDQLVFQFAGHGSQVDDRANDESDPYDEVIVPFDFDKGALWIDDDVYELCQELRKGATLTFFMDCCHSGTNTRFAPQRARSRSGATARFVRLEPREVGAYEKRRKGVRAAPRVSERKPIPGVVSFAACRDDQVAWEEGGRGNFSRHSMAVFDQVLRDGGSNKDFLDAVIAQFGDDRRQSPLLVKPAKGLERGRFLGGE